MRKRACALLLGGMLSLSLLPGCGGPEDRLPDRGAVDREESCQETASQETVRSFNETIKSVALVLQQVQEQGEAMSDELHAYAQVVIPRCKEIFALIPEELSQADAQALIQELEEVGQQLEQLLES